MNRMQSSIRLADPAMISGAAPLHSPHPSHQGQLQVIYGPMFSGKTTELIRRCKRFQLANYRCIVVKYAKDTRYSDSEVATHDRHTLAAVPAVNLRSIMGELLDYEVVAIDEGQFFPDIVPVSEELANKGKVVIVAALDGDFKREAFGSILELVPRAESVVKLNAVCMICYKTAAYTKRTSHDLAVEVIGGTDKYVAACRECHRVDGTTNVISDISNGNGIDDKTSTAPADNLQRLKLATRSPRKNQIMG